MDQRLAQRAQVALVGLGIVTAMGCSGGEAPPPPPPPPPTAEAPPAPPPTTSEPEVVPPETTTAPAVPAAPPPPRVPRTLALTYAGGCAIHDGRVSCWGESPREDEDEDPTERPEIQLTGDFVDLTASDSIACAVRAGAGLDCFGMGDDIAADELALEEEEAGDDWLADEEERRDIDRARDALTNAADLAISDSGACLVRRGGENTSAACAGDSFDAHALEGVRGTEGVVEVCVGAGFACGRTAGGQVVCWGANERGQLGDGTDSDEAESASRVRGLDRVLHIDCGAMHACALRDDHSVWCWGDNSAGTLGQSDELELSREPVRVPGLENVASIATGSGVSCALFDEGAPRCWGDNSTGLLGDGTTRTSATPVEATAIGPVREIDFGELHACAVRGEESAREIVCWGLGSEGALGPRARRRRFDPVELFAGAAVSRVGITSGSICAWVGADPASAEVRCVGSMGNDLDTGLEGARVPRTVPRSEVSSAMLSMLTGEGPRTLYVSRWVCSHEATALSCTSLDAPGSGAVTVADVTSAIASGTRICALHTNGTIECAAPTTTGALAFATQSHLPTASQLAITSSGLCVVLREDGGVVCEGALYGTPAGAEVYPPPSPDDAGPRPPGTPRPTDMHRYRNVTGVVQLASAGGLVARFSDGRVVRLSTTAAPVQLLDRADVVVEGVGFSCARRVGEQGTEAWCWGQNLHGQLATSGAPTVAQRIPGLEVALPARAEGDPPLDLATIGVREIVVGGSNACARLSDGRTLCWGADEDGQLGRAPEVLRLRPVVVLD
jgi:hypothetical protein